ncbi:MAG: hypothetical protein GXX79_03735 [Actinomycetales bacterium]|nr:hypothetical protein [Actinomycetales bacterium]
MLSGTGRGRRDPDRGTVAVIVAITLSLVLMAVGALAVDLGNAFARRRALQNSADLAAMAGAGKLPDIDEARTAALANLCGSATEEGAAFAGNHVNGWPRDACPADPSSATWDGDGDLDNGEIVFYAGSPGGGDRYLATQRVTSGHATAIRVVTPAARVDYGLARGVAGAPEGADVAASATARIGTPRASRGGRGTLPFYLRGDENGAFCLKQPEPGPGSAGPVDPPTTPATYTLDEIDPDHLPIGDTTSPVTLRLAAGSTPLPQANRTRVRVFFGGYQGAVVDVPDVWTIIVTVPLGAGEAGAVPVWFTYTTGNVTTHSDLDQTFAYDGGSTFVDCSDSSSQRGYMDLPRSDGTAQSLIRNIQSGAEPVLHSYLIWPDPGAGTSRAVPALNQDCYADGGLPEVVPAAANAGFTADVNCVSFDTGNITGPLETGFFDEEAGRMTQRCSDQTMTVDGRSVPMDGTDLFNPANGLLTEWGRENVATLRSRLLNGLPAPDHEHGWITAKIFDCPRFSLLPRFNVSAPPPNGSGAYPVLEFTYAWIDSYSPPDPLASGEIIQRGFIWEHAVGGALKGVTGFTIDPSYLPETVSTTEDVGDWIGPGSVSQVVLIHDESDPPT